MLRITLSFEGHHGGLFEVTRTTLITGEAGSAHLEASGDMWGGFQPISSISLFRQTARLVRRGDGLQLLWLDGDQN
jgi:hypothetical protein